MLELAVIITDVILDITILVVAAKWAAKRTDRTKAIIFACAVGSIYAVASNFSFSYLASSYYDRSLNALLKNALITIPFNAAIAYFATRRRRAVPAQ